MLQAIWGQLLATAGIVGAERERIVEALSELEQNEIAQSREIAGASVRPRFRLMAEAHPDGNIHRYREIAARTVNLIIKKEHDLAWIVREFARDDVSARLETVAGEPGLILSDDIRIRLLTIDHRRNGPHLVLQLKLDG